MPPSSRPTRLLNPRTLRLDDGFMGSPSRVAEDRPLPPNLRERLMGTLEEVLEPLAGLSWEGFSNAPSPSLARVVTPEVIEAARQFVDTPILNGTYLVPPEVRDAILQRYLDSSREASRIGYSLFQPFPMSFEDASQPRLSMLDRLVEPIPLALHTWLRMKKDPLVFGHVVESNPHEVRVCISGVDETHYNLPTATVVSEWEVFSGPAIKSRFERSLDE